jgi:hypothetical protein
MENLTEKFILESGYFGKSVYDEIPCLFNGDNILLFDKGGFFDAYLHSEGDGSIFFAVRLFNINEFKNFYLGIEKVKL